MATLDKFMKYLEQIFKHRHQCRLLWREQAGRSIATYPPMRWWSKWECEKQVLELFGDIPLFLISLRSIGKAQKTLENLDQLLCSKVHELVVFAI